MVPSYSILLHGKTTNGIIGEKNEFILLRDLNCDLLETISKSKHLIHIYNTYGLTQVIKEATRTAAETNTLTYYIVTNKKNIAYSGIIPCGISDHDLVYIIRHAGLPKINKDPKIVTVRSTKNLNNDTPRKALNEFPFELIRASADNPFVKLEIFLFGILNKYAPVNPEQAGEGGGGGRNRLTGWLFPLLC